MNQSLKVLSYGIAMIFVFAAPAFAADALIVCMLNNAGYTPYRIEVK